MSELVDYRPVRGIAIAAVALVLLSAFHTALGMGARWYIYFGGGAVDPFSVWQRLFRYLALPGLLLEIAAPVVFIVWLWRARNNAELRCRAPHRLARGWTIGGWFCPIVQLWFPLILMIDVWRASDPRTPADAGELGVGRRSWLVYGWWIAWMLAAAINVASGLVSWGQTGWSTLLALTTVSALLTVAAAIMVALIVQTVTGWQTTTPFVPWWEAQAAQPVTPVPAPLPTPAPEPDVPRD
ncbi:DUF4328 domain-containing protein [Longimycelium tulufanense]|nr:DUF4328 domain-containing protein [Longimycelium tulufanense]